MEDASFLQVSEGLPLLVVCDGEGAQPHRFLDYLLLPQEGEELLAGLLGEGELDEDAELEDDADGQGVERLGE